jgi:hypothetical protein
MSKHIVGDLVVAKRVTKQGTMQPEYYNLGRTGEVMAVHTMGRESFYSVKFGANLDMIDEVCLERIAVSA